VISFKAYECKKCGYEKEIDTNHFGECYSLGKHNQCPKCVRYQPCDGPALIPTVTTWVCAEGEVESCYICDALFNSEDGHTVAEDGIPFLICGKCQKGDK